MHLQRQPCACLAQPGMVRHRLGRAQPQELAQRQAVGATPFQAPLAVGRVVEIELDATERAAFEKSVSEVRLLCDAVKL